MIECPSCKGRFSVDERYQRDRERFIVVCQSCHRSFDVTIRLEKPETAIPADRAPVDSRSADSQLQG